MPYVFLFFFSSSCIWTFYLNSSCCTQACSLIYIVCFVAMLSVFHNSLKVYVILFYLVNLSLFFFFFERFTFITVSFTHLPILMGLGGLVDPKAIDEIFVENISTWPNLAEPPHHFRSFIYSDIHSQLNKRIL